MRIRRYKKTILLVAAVIFALPYIAFLAVESDADDSLRTLDKKNSKISPTPITIEKIDNGFPIFKTPLFFKRSRFVSNELLVRFKKTSSHASRKHMLGRHGVIEDRRGTKSKHSVLKLPPNWSVSDAKAWFAAQEIVALAEPNYIYITQESPDDEHFDDQWALKHINADSAWNFETGSSDIVIAIIDTGVDYNHADLAANMWRNPGELSGDGVDNDQNGFIDDDIGWDFVSDTFNCKDEDCGKRDRDPMDGHGHGTHVAGIAAAVAGNGTGIAGVTWGCRIMAIRVGYEDWTGDGIIELSDAAEGIYYAVDNGAKILNLSWGSTNQSALLQDAIAYASEHGVVVCAAAGNQNTATNFYPAAYNGPLVLAVGATDQTDHKSSFSSFGTWVDVSAPGSSILSTCLNDDYCRKNGSSMAAPHVAGMAGLLLSQFRGWSTEFLTTILLNSVDVFSDLEGINASSGIINLAMAMEVDPSDLALFTEQIAQSFGNVACSDSKACEGDMDDDQDVDGLDLSGASDL